MSKFITIPGFKGGESLDLFDRLANQTFQKGYDLDTYVDKNILGPIKMGLQAITLPTITNGTDILVDNSFVASDNKIYIIGSAVVSAATNIVLWSASKNLTASPTYTAEYNTNTGGIGVTPLEEYKDGIFFGWSTNLDRWGDLSGSPSRTNIGTVTTAITYLRHHRGLGLLFFAHNSGRTIGKYDDSTFTASSLTLDIGDTVVGMEELGRFLVIGR